MTQSEKDLAIYQAIREIANEVFNEAANDEVFKETISVRGAMTLHEIVQEKTDARYALEHAIGNDNSDLRHVSVDTFSCSFPKYRVFKLLQNYKQIAGVRGNCVFSVREEIKNEFVGSATVTFHNPSGAKRLASHADDLNGLRPAQGCVLMEVNTTTGDVFFVATNAHMLSVVSNGTTESREGDTYRALFSPKDWERICDYARTSKSSVTFSIYKRGENEENDTMIAQLGDTIARSSGDYRFPDWHSVIPDESKMHSFDIHPDDVKAAQKFVKGLPKEIDVVNISFYLGSDRVYFDAFAKYDDIEKHASFRITEPSEVTIGTCSKGERLKKVMFTGFAIEESEKPFVVADANADLTLVMPYVDTNGYAYVNTNGYVFDVEEREVVSKAILEVA